jgi:hypothetical protein
MQSSRAKSTSKSPSKVRSDWLTTLYRTSLLDEKEILSIYDNAKYRGFDRDAILSQLQKYDPKLVAEMVIVCALRGPQKATIIKLRNGKTMTEMGIPASGKQGTTDLSCNRISAATADLAAFYLKKLRVPKRILDLDLVGWLQFPTAGSIKLPKLIREQHTEFHKRFSPMIGGVFNEQIYSQMEENSYLDPKLDLFGDH